jgi:transcriptional regulator with XRE-family HTH domain
MKLADYLEKNEIDQASFAKALGVTKKAVQFWVGGERHPRLEQMQKIAEATKGEVMPNDFLSFRAEGSCETSIARAAQEARSQEMNAAAGDAEPTPTADRANPHYPEAAE